MLRRLPVIVMTLQVKILKVGIRGLCKVLDAMEEFVSSRKD